jgi:hypothetical protein
VPDTIKVLIKRGESVKVYGKDTKKDYGSRSFYLERQWDVR